MSVESALAAGRGAALARMTSQCTVMRQTGNKTESGGLLVPEWAAVHVDLPCQVAGGAGATPQSGIRPADIEAHIGNRTLKLPFDTADLADNDLVEITAGDNTGVVLRLLEVSGVDQVTALRVPAVTAQRPREWS